jgi:replicative DNA helicase
MAVEQQYDALAEQAVLATLFTNPEMLDELNDIITHDDFYEERNKVIYETANDLQTLGKPFDAINLAGEIKQRGLMGTIGGITYIRELLTPDNLTAYSSNPIGYAEIISDLSRRRKMLDIAVEINQTATIGAGMSSSEALLIAEERILALSQSDTLSKPSSAADVFDETLAKIEEAGNLPENAVRGIESGFPALDNMTGGWKPGQMIVIAARPSVGKTALAMDFARAATYLGGKSTLFFSMEMSVPDLMLRLIAAEGPILYKNLLDGKLSQEELMELRNVEDKIKKNNLFFDDTAKVTLSHIRSRAIRQKHSAAGLDLLIIDYLGLVEMPVGNKNYNRANEVGELARQIKILAKELEIPIIVLSQLNRASESRDDKRPSLHDLRESGGIEQDADTALLIHRPDQSDPNIRPGEADLIVAKNRSGPIGTIPLTPMLAYQKYVPGEGIIQRDNSVYDTPEVIASAVEGQVVYPAPSEEDEAPW